MHTLVAYIYMVFTEFDFFSLQVKITFLHVREHGNSINFHKYFDISAILNKISFNIFTALCR